MPYYKITKDLYQFQLHYKLSPSHLTKKCRKKKKKLPDYRSQLLGLSKKGVLKSSRREFFRRVGIAHHSNRCSQKQYQWRLFFVGWVEVTKPNTIGTLRNFLSMTK